jgi:iron complex transport system permease protein
MALAGILIQSSTRNPLSSPSVLGLNSCASFFVCTYLVFDKLSKGASLLGASLLGSLFGASLLFLMGHFVDAKKFPGRIILVGVCLGMMMSSLTNLVVILDENNTQSLVYWLLGGVDGKSWSDFQWLVVPFTLCFLASLFLIRPLEALKLGDEMVLSLGHHPQKTRLFCLVLGLFLVSSVVAICGPLAFLGLIVPHLSRKLFGESMKALLPLGTLFGGVFLIYADWFSRYIQFPYETPVGILSGLLGGAYFLYLSIKENLAHA